MLLAEHQGPGPVPPTFIIVLNCASPACLSCHARNFFSFAVWCVWSGVKLKAYIRLHFFLPSLIFCKLYLERKKSERKRKREMEGKK